MYGPILSALLFAFSLFCVPANSDAAELSGFFCAELENEALYDQQGLKNYKTMIEGLDGWVFRSVPTFNTSFSATPQTISYLKDLQDSFKKHGTDLILVLPPSRGLVHHTHIQPADKKKYGFDITTIENAWNSYRSLLETLRQSGINAVGVPALDLNTSFFYKRDHHWNPDGAKQTAEAVASFIKTTPVYKNLTKKEFATTQTGTRTYPGAFRNAFKKLCGTALPPETAPVYKTEPLEHQTNETSLFNTIRPDVVLTGTSNSAPERNVANFDGFLKEALSVDVDNRALAGAGIDSSLLAYINSKDFKTQPAKIVLWEIPVYYDLNKLHGQVFAQAIPALYGDCRDKALNTKTFTLEKNKIISLTDNTASATNTSTYISLTFSKPLQTPFTVTLEYNATEEKHTFKRSDRYPKPNDPYFLALDTQKKGSLKSISFDFSKTVPDRQATLKICAR